MKAEREKNNRKTRAENWWLLGETLPAFREATRGLSRYLATARVAKHRIFVWLDTAVLPDSKVIAIASADDAIFGVLQSRVHGVWADEMQALHGGERPTYNPTECFETFPFPFPFKAALPQGESTPQSEADAGHYYFTAKEDPAPYGEAAIKRAATAAAAMELNERRDRWLNPPEWTHTEWLAFRATASGPWSRFVEANSIDTVTGIGTASYPRTVPRDEKCAAKLKVRTLTALYNERPAWLDLAHKK